jgi:hypothetical protein
MYAEVSFERHFVGVGKMASRQRSFPESCVLYEDSPPAPKAVP